MNIITRLWYFVVGEPCVGRAISKLNRTIAKIEKASTYQTTKAERMEEAARMAKEAAANANEEAIAARRVGNNLRKLLED